MSSARVVPTSAPVVIAGGGLSGVATAFFLAAVHGAVDVVVIDPRPPLSYTSAMSTECYRDAWPSRPMRSLMSRSVDLFDAGLAPLPGADPVAPPTSDGQAVMDAILGALGADHDDKEEWSAGIEALARRQCGYVYLSADPSFGKSFADEYSSGGTDVEVRVHAGREEAASRYRRLGEVGEVDALVGVRGMDVLEGSDAVEHAFPMVAGSGAQSAVHARRCGWLSAQQLGSRMMAGARAASGRRVHFVSGTVDRVKVTPGPGARVDGVEWCDASGVRHSIKTDAFVNASGPFLAATNRLLGGTDSSLPVYNEVHSKVVMDDPFGAVPRDAPMMIWMDAQRLRWPDGFADMVAAAVFDGETAEVDAGRLLGLLPGGVHFRPYGNASLLCLWEYFHAHRRPSDPPEPQIEFESGYPEVVVRGLSAMVPGLARYADALPPLAVDGGYYCRTTENIPLAGPYRMCEEAVAHGAYVAGAMSGYGVMACAAVGEVVADCVARGGEADASRFPYAPVLSPQRYADPDLLGALRRHESGQI